MSSPGGGKVTRAVPPWSKDYHTPVTTIDTDKILRSTLTEETRTQKGDTKTCLICGLSYFFSPIRYREHLGLTDSSKQEEQCKPYPEHLEHSSQDLHHYFYILSSHFVYILSEEPVNSIPHVYHTFTSRTVVR